MSPSVTPVDWLLTSWAPFNDSTGPCARIHGLPSLGCPVLGWRCRAKATEKVEEKVPPTKEEIVVALKNERECLKQEAQQLRQSRAPGAMLQLSCMS